MDTGGFVCVVINRRSLSGDRCSSMEGEMIDRLIDPCLCMWVDRPVFWVR